MRPLEILIPILLAIYLLWSLTGRKRPAVVRLLPLLALVAIAARTPAILFAAIAEPMPAPSMTIPASASRRATSVATAAARSG